MPETPPLDVKISKILSKIADSATGSDRMIESSPRLQKAGFSRQTQRTTAIVQTTFCPDAPIRLRLRRAVQRPR